MKKIDDETLVPTVFRSRKLPNGMIFLGASIPKTVFRKKNHRYKKLKETIKNSFGASSRQINFYDDGEEDEYLVLIRFCRHKVTNGEVKILRCLIEEASFVKSTSYSGSIIPERAASVILA